MRALDLIIKKRDGGKLASKEIDLLVKGFTTGEIPDYQMSALLMAIYLKGLDFEETRELTRAFIESGERVDLREVPGIKVDKHSTGGVGDKTTLVVVPLVAAAGAVVVKMSGRSLGHTGGTLDKLNSIPGFRTDLDLEEIRRAVARTGAVMTGHTANLVPADKKVYALRDVTGTVDSLPLIASSIMSKKIAGGADNIVLDVKVGSGGFMKDLEEARELAAMLVELGREFERRTVALLSSMDQPLGQAVGNALEVEEAIAALKGQGPADLEELSLSLGAQMLTAAGLAPSAQEGYRTLRMLLQEGTGLQKLREIIQVQGGNPAVIDEPELLPRPARRMAVTAERSGYVQRIDAREIGWVSLLLGAGRLQKDDQVDPAVGVTLNKKIGEQVEKGEILAMLHINREDNLGEALERCSRAFSIVPERPNPAPLVYQVIA